MCYISIHITDNLKRKRKQQLKFPKYFLEIWNIHLLLPKYVCVCACTHVCIKRKLLFLVNKTFLQKTKVIHLALNIKRTFKLFYICVISNPKKLFKDFFVQLFKLRTITKMTSVTHSPKAIGRGLFSRVQSALATAYLSS